MVKLIIITIVGKSRKYGINFSVRKIVAEALEVKKKEGVS